jgi:lipid-binding SYLF domain-containing protein
MTSRIKILSMLLPGALLALSFASNSIAGPAREEVRLVTATQILEEVQAMPDQRLPDTLLAHAYGIAVIPDVTQIALIFGGRHGNGVLTMRETLNSPWSNPVFVSLTGASGGLQVGMQASDIILVFTTKSGVDGIALGKLTLGADASVAAGPVGRQATAATDVSLAEIYSYARTRGLFGGIAIDGSAIAIDKSANRAFYGKPNVTASEILSGSAPTPPETAQRFLARLAKTTHSTVRGSPAPQADMPAAAQVTPVPAPTAPAEEPRTYPLESPSPN